MDREQDSVAAWIAREILPYESSVRKWLSRRQWPGVDANEVIQEAYCRIAGLASVENIDNPAGYFHRTVQTVAVDAMRRAGKIKFVSMNEIEWSNVIDDEPLADRALAADQELGRVNQLLNRLSDTCRRAIELRRIEGLSQRETAECLGVSESVVRNHLVRGLQKVLQAMEAEDEENDNDKQQIAEVEVSSFGKLRYH